MSIRKTDKVKPGGLAGTERINIESRKGDNTNEWFLYDTSLQEIADLGGGVSYSDIIEIPTSETDTDLVLKPDGIGGVGWESSPSSEKSELGEIINESFDNITNWTNVGSATFTLNNGQLNISGGNNTANNYLRYDGYGVSNLESWTLTVDVHPALASTTTYGIGVNVKSQGIYQNTFDNIIKVDLTSANFGQLTVSSLGVTQVLASSSINGLTASTEPHKLTVKFIKNKYTVTFENTITKLSSVVDYEITSTTPFLSIVSNALKWGIIAYGGTHSVDNFIINANDIIEVDYLFVGDSIMKGLTTDNIANRCSNLISTNFNTITLTNAGASNVIEDINIDEVVSLAPKNIIILIGVNNLQAGDTPIQAKTKYDALVSGIISGSGGAYTVGVNMFIGLLTPYTSQAANILTLNSLLIDSYTTGIIDFYTEAISGTSFNNIYSLDGIHPNNEYHLIMADIIANRLLLPALYNQIGNFKKVNYNANGKVSIASKRYAGMTPSFQMDIVDESAGQLRVGLNGGTGGGYLFSASDDSVNIAGGGYYQNLNSTASATTATQLALVSGNLRLYTNTGLTPGNNYSPSLKFTLNDTGMYVGGSDSPTALVHIAASTTAKSHMRFTPGADPSSPNDGDVWFDGTNLYIRVAGVTRSINLT